MTRRILSIDGGGVRGIIPAVALAAFEAEIKGRARDHFDFVAGTSTGALVAAAVAAGVPAERIVEMYLRRAPALFHRIPVISTLQRVLFGRLYDVERLHRFIKEELGAEGAADWRLNDVPLDIMVTAKGLDDGHQWFFVKDQPSNASSTGQLGLADCLTASAAAPTFFGPWTVPGFEHEGPMVDGGTGVAGNPVYQACVEAFSFMDRYQAADTIVVSLGTGQFLERGRPTWLYSWLGWLLSELLRSPGEQQTELVDRHFAAATFYRIDVRLEREFPLDDPSQMAALRDIGERLAARIDWPAVLEGRDTEWLVTRHRRQPQAYAEAV
ncbi:MAG TPA: patatin-like phospholipase family protein [Candidatus Limnocylindria bacterium]